MANLAAALAPLLTSGRATSQQQQSTSPTGNLLADLMTPSPARTQAQQMRTTIGGMFGLDTRPPIEKLQEQLAGMSLSTAADYTNAAKAAKDLGLSAQAVQLNALATQKEKEEEELRVKTQATVSQRGAGAQRVAVAMQNTTDPRVKRELAALLPSVANGLLSGSELTTAIDQSIERYSIEPLTAAERESIGRLVDEDPELQSLMQNPGFFARLFGAEDATRGREELIREFGRIQQMNPGISDSQIIDMFLADNQSAIEMVVEGEGTDAPTETVSTGIPPYSPPADNKARLTSSAEIGAELARVNAELKSLGYPEDDAETRKQRSKAMERWRKENNISPEEYKRAIQAPR